MSIDRCQIHSIGRALATVGTGTCIGGGCDGSNVAGRGATGSSRARGGGVGVRDLVVVVADMPLNGDDWSLNSGSRPRFAGLGGCWCRSRGSGSELTDC